MMLNMFVGGLIGALAGRIVNPFHDANGVFAWLGIVACLNVVYFAIKACEVSP